MASDLCGYLVRLISHGVNLKIAELFGVSLEDASILDAPYKEFDKEYGSPVCRQFKIAIAEHYRSKKPVYWINQLLDGAQWWNPNVTSAIADLRFVEEYQVLQNTLCIKPIFVRLTNDHHESTPQSIRESAAESTDWTNYVFDYEFYNDRGATYEQSLADLKQYIHDYHGKGIPPSGS